MLLAFEDVISIATGENPVAVHLQNNDVYVFYFRENNVYYKYSNPTAGNWANLIWSPEEVACTGVSAFNIHNKYWSGTYTWFTWDTGTTQDVAMFPIPIFKMNPVFFRGFMAGLVGAQQMKTSKPQDPPINELNIADKDPDYYNGYVLGMTAIQSS